MLKIVSIIFTLLFFFTSCATKGSAINSDNRASNISDMQSRMVAYVNTIRQKGAMCAPPAPALNYNSSLERAAQEHAKDMALNNRFSHTGSGTSTDLAKSAVGVGSSHIERIIYFGYPNKPGKLLGEVLSYTKVKDHGDDYFAHFKHAIKNLINDRTHCEIVMNPRFSDVGMGMYKSDDRYYFVMNLGEKPN